MRPLELQARLDNASRWGSWVRPSAHAPLRAEHWHPRHASLVRHTRETLCGSRWVHILGDSTGRFLYASWLTLLNGSTRAPGFPLHTLPDDDKCSFRRVGWPTTSRGPCKERWRGPCYDHVQNCTLDFRAPNGWRVSFAWWHGGFKSFPPPPLLGSPDLVLVALGTWEARTENGRGPNPHAMHHKHITASFGIVAQLRAQLQPDSAVVVMGNGLCRANQHDFWRKSRGPRAQQATWPPPAFEALVAEGNRETRAFVRRTAANGGAPLAYLDRTASMASAPKDTQSPCFAYHPYGALSDLHVEVLLNAVLCRPPPR